jgi:hypothetical protein
MANVKFTNDGQQKRLERLEALRATRKDIADLADLKNDASWGKLAKVYRKYESYAKNEEKRTNLEHDSGDIDAQTFSKLATRFRQKQADFDLAASILDKHSEMVKEFDDQISFLEKQFKVAKEALA